MEDLKGTRLNKKSEVIIDKLNKIQEAKMKLREQLKLEEDGWEIVEKGKWNTHRMPEGTASIRKKCINVSEDLRKFVEGYYGVEIFINRTEKLIGIRPSNDEIKAFRVKNPSKGGLIAMNVERYTDKFGIFKAEWDATSEMIIVDLNNPLSLVENKAN